jgi:hypothetical protein
VLFLKLRRRLVSPSDLAVAIAVLASRDFWRAFLAGRCSLTAGCVSSIFELAVSGSCAALVLFDRERVNANPSSSSSYTVCPGLEQNPQIQPRYCTASETIFGRKQALLAAILSSWVYAPCFLFPFPTTAFPVSAVLALAFVDLELAPLDWPYLLSPALGPTALGNIASSFSASLELVLRVLLR